ncbi:MAG: helix-turn-helix domain-containing protein [Chloroflexi bacterium]|nr:helix-turn-helix domain-containing protein [Chloroflexota bacterium]
MPDESLVSIREASRILGINEATLRLWTDEGKIGAFVTPGGHRRYSRADLRRFAGLQTRVHGVKDVVARLEEAALSQQEIARTGFGFRAAYLSLGDESRHRLAACGRELLNVTILHVTEPSKRDQTVRLARDVGKRFALELVSLGIPLTDALEAFLLHRAPFVAAITSLMKKREMLNERAVEAIPLVTNVMDEALIALVSVYQQTGQVVTGNTLRPPSDADADRSSG